MELQKVIAQNIQRLLDEKKVAATELGAALQVSRVTISNYLKASTTVDSVRLVQIANYFDVPVDYLLTEHTEGRPAILFRSALHYQEAVDEVEELVSAYLTNYEELARSVGKKICYLPEQYNLSMNYRNKVIDINFVPSDVLVTQPRIDDALKQEIWRIADYQRSLIGLDNNGAIDLISALTLRGVNVIFLDLHTSEVSGLSICDDSRGCFIFVNSNAGITFERQLFTIAHEYGHIVLHRPVFKQRFWNGASEKKQALLDKMADCFAGRLLCPPKLLQPYADRFAGANGNLSDIISTAIPIKRLLQISLQSLMVAMKEYRIVSPKVVDEYYRILHQTNTGREEPMSFAENEVLRARFLHEREANILRMLSVKSARGELQREDIAYFLDCNDVRAGELYQQLEKEKDAVLQVLKFYPGEKE